MKIVHRSDFLFFSFRNEIIMQLTEICKLYNINCISRERKPNVKEHIWNHFKTGIAID